MINSKPYLWIMSETGTKKKVFDFSLLRRIFSICKTLPKPFLWFAGIVGTAGSHGPLRPLLIQLTLNDGIKMKRRPFYQRTRWFYHWNHHHPDCAFTGGNHLPFYFTYLTASLGAKRCERPAGFGNKILHLNLRQFDSNSPSATPPPYH